MAISVNILLLIVQIFFLFIQIAAFMFYQIDKDVLIQEDYYDLLYGDRYGKWMPVSEALPEISGYYLVTVRKDKRSEVRGVPAITNVATDRYNSYLNRWESFDGLVVAWMVPPKGYKKH